MSDDHHGAFVVGEEAFQPGHRFGVQVVGGFVQKQEVGALQQKPAQGDAAALAARNLGDIGVPRRTAERIHGDLDGALELPAPHGVDLFLQLPLFGQERVHRVVVHGFGETRADLLEALEKRRRLAQSLHDVSLHVLGRIEFRLLGQVPDFDAIGGPRLAAEFVVEPGHDPQHRGLAGAIDTEHADLGARQERKRYALEDLAPPGKDLGEPLHDIGVLVRSH